MEKKTVFIINKLGLHIRAAAALVKLISNFQSDVNLTFNNNTVNGKSIMGVMMLAAAKGSEIVITTIGRDEKDAMVAITQLINARFGEAE